MSLRAKIVVLVVAGLLAGMVGSCTSTPEVVEKEVTQVVEKEVTQVVEKEVTQVVEKEVTQEVVATPTPQPEAYKVGWVMKTLDNPYWVDADKYGKVAARELGGLDLWAYSVGGETQIANELGIMEDLIALQMDAIVVAPVDSDGIVPAIENANDAGIPVVTLDTAAAGGDIESFVAIDNFKAAALDAEYLAEELLPNQEGKVAVLEGILAQSTGRERKAGFVETLEDYPDIEVVASLPGEWSKAKGMAAAEDILTAHPDIDAILASNDMMALGAVEAARAAGKLEDIYILGFDGVQEALEAVKEGTMAATSLQNPRIMAVWGLMAAKKVLDGEEVPDRIETPLALITPENVDQYLATVPPVEEVRGYMEDFPD